VAGGAQDRAARRQNFAVQDTGDDTPARPKNPQDIDFTKPK
jgi:hypothetical protein